MKTLNLLVILFITPLFTNAQNPISNPSFENWNWYDTAHTLELCAVWTYPNSQVPYPFKSSDACDGNYSVLLTDSLYGWNGIGQTLNWTGTLPTGISFCYKYKSTPNDTAYFQALFSDINGGQQFYVLKKFTQDTNVWTQVNLFFPAYSTTSTLFGLEIGAACSNSNQISLGYSQLLIDNINLLYSPNGINDIGESLSSVSIYPNPSNGQFKLTNKNNSNISSIEITNMLGETIYTASNLIPQIENKIDLSNNPKGVYFLKIYEGTKTYNKKIVIQ